MSKKIHETKQRFTIKKFKIGAASVLVGTVFAAFASQAQVYANEATVPTEETTTVQVAPAETPATEEVQNEVASAPVEEAKEETTPEVAAENQPASSETPVEEKVEEKTEETPAAPAEEKVEEKKEDAQALPKQAPVTKPTVSFKASNTLPTNPANNAQARPENEGQAIPKDKAFRDAGNEPIAEGGKLVGATVEPNPPIADPYGATVAKRELSESTALERDQTIDLSKYTLDPDKTKNTFQVVDLGRWNTHNNDKDYYYTASVAYPENANDKAFKPVTVKLYSKSKPGEVIEEITINPGQTGVELQKVNEAKPGNPLVFNYTTSGYTLYDLYNGQGEVADKPIPEPTLDPTKISGTITTANFGTGGFKGVQLLNILSNLDTTREGTYVNGNATLVPRMIEDVTNYVVVDPKNTTYKKDKADATVQDYVPNGNETLLASHTLTALTGEKYRGSGVREFEGYELYQIDDRFGTEFISTGNFPVGTTWQDGRSGNGVKRIRQVIAEDQTMKIWVYVKKPSAAVEETKLHDTSIEGYELIHEVVIPPSSSGRVTVKKTIDIEGQSLSYNTDPISIYNKPGEEGNLVFIPNNSPLRDTSNVGPLAGKGYANGSGTVLNNPLSLFNGTTHYYVKQGTVKVQYIDVDGNVLEGNEGTITKDPALVAEKQASGTAYDTTKGFRPDTIVTPEGKTFKRVAVATVAEAGTVDENGRLTENAAGKTFGTDAATGVVEAATDKVITYVYEEVKGKVNVNYLDEQGNVIKDSAVVAAEGSTGRDYDATTAELKPATITTPEGKTYELVEDLTNKRDANTDVNNVPKTGKVVEGTTEVNYVYREVKGQVNVNYLDEQGNKIQDSAVAAAEGSTGRDYDAATETLKPTTITTADGKVYELVPNTTNTKDLNADVENTDETGKVKPGVTEVNYVYKEVKGQVNVNYLDEQGNKIQDSAVAAAEGSAGRDYDAATETLKPKTITTADGKTYELVPNTTNTKDLNADVENTDETGKVKPGVTEVNYVYKEVKGQVNVNYLDENGKQIQESAVVAAEGSTGRDYDATTAELKPETITTADGKVYELVPTATNTQDLNAGVENTDETGKVKPGVTEVNYVYKEVKGQVNVNYLDENGEKIQDSAVAAPEGSAGRDYDAATETLKPKTITTADGKTYELVPNTTNTKDLNADVENTDETGKVKPGVTEVNYVYKEVPGSVVVNYVTADGTVIKDPAVVAAEGSTGRDYDAANEEFRPETITTADGKVYKLKVNQKFDKDPNVTDVAPTGKVPAGKSELTYVYELEQGSVSVNYLDEKGNKLQDSKDVVKNTDTGTDYDATTEALKPNRITTADGKVYELVPTATNTQDLTKDVPNAEEKGKVTPGVKEVNYVYKEVKGNVVVNYVDTEGNVIAEQAKDETDASMGTKYDTTDKKPEKIEKDGTVYYYKEVKPGDKESGKVVEGTTEVTYVYEKAGNVVVNYVLEDGTVIQEPVKDTVNGKPGTGYNTEDHKPTTITKDGKTYELVPTATKGAETGNVEAGKTTEVTYVYKEVVAPKGSVIVNYVTEDGTVVREKVELKKDSPVDEPYNAETDPISAPQKEITFNGKTYVLVPEITKDIDPSIPNGAVDGKVINGTLEVTFVYREKVTPEVPVPTATPSTTTDVQGKTQTGKVVFTPGHKDVPIDETKPATFEDGSTTKVIPGEGTYVVSPDGTVTFTPEPNFVGTAKGVTVVRVDTNGTPASSTYTPTVTPVTPTATPSTTTDVQGKTQTGKVVFTPGHKDVPIDETKPATFEDGSTTKVVPGEGTYVVSPDGTVTFTPEPNFVGTAKGVTVVRVDTNGTPAKSTYTPTVTPVTPTATPSTTTDVQGKTQTGKVVFTPGHKDVPIDETIPATFEDGSTTKVVPGEGTYVVSPDGTVTFTPEPNFVGTAKGVTVVRVDTNGTPAKSTYTPTVTPVRPSNTNPGQPGNATPSQPGSPVSGQPGNPVPGQPGNTTPSQPGSPVPGQPGNAAPSQPGNPVPGQPGNAAPSTSSNQVVTNPMQATYTKETLPNTGEESSVVTMVGVATLLGTLGLAAKARRKEN